MFRTLRVPATLLGAALVTALACSGDEGPTAIEIPLATVQITSGCSAIGEGESCVMAARGMTAQGQVVTNAVLRWSSSSPSIVQVNSEGRVFGLAPGKATITVEAAIGQGMDSSDVSVFPCTKC